MMNLYVSLSGGLFDMKDTVQEIAFRYAVDRVNSIREILPRSRLTAQIERLPQQDSFYASKQGMCYSGERMRLCLRSPTGPKMASRQS